MDLDAKTILQVNAALIVGALISLAYSSTLSGGDILPAIDELQGNRTDLVRVLPMIQILIIFFLLIPFVIAGATMIQGNLISPECMSSDQYRQVSMKKLGFGILFLVAGLLIISFIDITALH
jgi:hypothetical protein